MIIDKILNQSRRDFTAIYRCEHCDETVQKRGYDDDNFHRNVVPNMSCESCGKKADSDTFRPWGTKYPAGQVV